jgi:hypothetical protein
LRSSAQLASCAGLTSAAAAGVAVAVGEPVGHGVFYGFAFALSSTAIVLRALSERRELDAPHGRFIVGTLIFQDLCVVPMVLIVPILGATSGAADAATEIGIALAEAAAVVLGTIVVARVLVPRVLGWVDPAPAAAVDQPAAPLRPLRGDRPPHAQWRAGCDLPRAGARTVRRRRTSPGHHRHHQQAAPSVEGRVETRQPTGHHKMLMTRT